MAKKINKYAVLRVVFALLGVALIIASMRYDGEHNWFLPLGLVSTSIASIINYRERNK